MRKPNSHSSTLNLSVEEENLAGIPFAVLERRVGKQIGRIEIRGTKSLPDGTDLEVLWQVEGNNELGLPTEQDLDIFVALGVLTFRGNFSKTVTFTGREIAKILNIKNVHGKFYQRIKLAMDRFIPLRFRALSSTDEHEEVKWLNVFQEASFSLNRTTGRCTGTITWTDKLIRSMDSGFFRVLDARRYMVLDGITAKHLYRFLAVAFEKSDLIVIDARKLASEHLGIFNLPQYLSRLMQTLEPPFEQLMRIGVIGSYHVVDAANWTIALHRHPSYVPERKALLESSSLVPLEAGREVCRQLLEKGGFQPKLATLATQRATRHVELYRMQRLARLAEQMKQEEVLSHVAVATLRPALEFGVETDEALEVLDWAEIALDVCRYKKQAGQQLRNLPGLLVKIANDPEAQQRLVNQDVAASYRQRFRDSEQAALRVAEREEERQLVLQYEQFRQGKARALFELLSEGEREKMRKEKMETLRQHGRLEKLPIETRELEIEQLIIQAIAKRDVPSFERWKLRMLARQVALPFGAEEISENPVVV
jgi:hypothetical protein